MTAGRAPTVGPGASADAWLAATTLLIARYVERAAAAGYPAAADLRLETVDRPCCPAYEDSRHVILVNLPGVTTVSERLFWCYYASLLGCADISEAQAACAHVLPLLVSHEVNHHLRHLSGRATADHFEEEQVCHLLALAWMREQPDLAESLPRLRTATQRALRRLRRLAPFPELYEKGEHLSLAETLADEHLISWRSLHHAERIARLHAATVDDVLSEEGLMTPELRKRAQADQEATRRAFDDEYMQDLARYWHFGTAFVVHSLVHGPYTPYEELVDSYLGPG